MFITIANSSYKSQHVTHCLDCVPIAQFMTKMGEDFMCLKNRLNRLKNIDEGIFVYIYLIYIGVQQKTTL